MPPTRRRVLSAAGVGMATTVLARPGRVTAASSGDAERVFVHPERTLVGSVADVVGSLGGAVLHEYENFPFVVASVPGDAVADLANTAGVALVERDRRIELERPIGGVLDGVDLGDGIDVGSGGGDGDGDDDGGGSCVGHPPQESAWGYERIGAADAEGTGDGVDVAVLDTGIETSHCDLTVAGGRNVTHSGGPNDYEDRNGHGTHCAGIVSARDNDAGVVGVAPAANLYAVKVLDDDGNGFQSWLAAGIDWCLENGIELVSMSLGSDGGTAAIDAAIEEATARGHLLIGSAGNRGNDGDGSCAAENVTYPATHDDVLSVTAMDRDDSLASYSSVGSAVDLLAPGSTIRSTTVGDDYEVQSGTSMAAPHVTGVAALIWERAGASGPGDASDQVRRTLLETAEPVLETCAEGEGLVDAAAATAVEQEPGDDADDGDDSDDADGADQDRDGSSGGATDGGGGSGSGTGGTTDEVVSQAESLWSRGIAALQSLLEALAGLFGR